MKEFGLTLRVYDGRSFADPTQTLAQVRKKKGSGKDLAVAKNLKVGKLEDKFEEEFGLKVQVARSTLLNKKMRRRLVARNAKPSGKKIQVMTAQRRV